MSFYCVNIGCIKRVIYKDEECSNCLKSSLSNLKCLEESYSCENLNCINKVMISGILCSKCLILQTSNIIPFLCKKNACFNIVLNKNDSCDNCISNDFISFVCNNFSCTNKLSQFNQKSGYCDNCVCI